MNNPILCGITWHRMLDNDGLDSVYVLEQSQCRGLLSLHLGINHMVGDT